MDSAPSPGAEWELNRLAFERLLAALGKDRDRAAVKYENIRKRLITFFECRGCSAPEEYTDIVINRVAKKLEQGERIYASDPVSYFFGVAYKVLQEYWAALKKAPEANDTSLTCHDESVAAMSASEHPDKVREREYQMIETDRELECLDKCLERLKQKDRDLVLEYYQGERASKIVNRQKLAARLGIQMNALRIKALRIRKNLESCISDCLSQSSPE